MSATMTEGRTFAALTADIRAINIEKGWRSPEGVAPAGQTFGDYIALLHSEASEALEAFRDHRLADATGGYLDDYAIERVDDPAPAPAKPEGVGAELADVLIRLLDTADVFGVRVSGYERIADLHDHAPDRRLSVSTFGDHVAWLHREISDALISSDRLGLVLRTLVTIARKFCIDLDAEVERKIAYNRTRSFQHGGRTLSATVPVMTPVERFNDLYFAIPTDPREWWISEETGEFLDQWNLLGLPRLTMHDASGEVLTVWCTDVKGAAAMIGMADHVGNDLGFTITRDDYQVCVVQADDK